MPVRRPSGKRPALPPPAAVIPLSAARARLARGRALRSADRLLALPDAPARIRALPGDELFHLVKETGLRDALDVLVHADAEQIQSLLDLDVWQRDAIAPERLDEWLDVLGEAPPEQVGSWLRGIDVEMLGYLLTTKARIYDLSEEEAPELSQGTVFLTPDRLFAIDVFGGGPDLPPPPLLRMLEALYKFDHNLARRILVGARSELPTELEETAFRWRSGRMADLGYVDYYEALEVYRELDPAEVTLGEAPRRTVDAGASLPDDALRAPGPLARRLAEGRGPFTRALGGVTDEREWAALQADLVALGNRVLSADRVSPGDDAAATAGLQRMLATLDLAVEFMARGAEDRALESVRTVPFLRLFRLGVSVVGKVGALARALRERGPFAALRPRVSTFEIDDAVVLEATARLRPMFPRVLDRPAATGERPFASLDDVALAAAALERAGASQAILVGLGVTAAALDPDALGLGALEAPVIDAGTIARTVLVRQLAGERGPLRPLPARLVAGFRPDARALGQAEAALRAAAPAALRGAAVEAVITRWIGSLRPLGEVLREPAQAARRRAEATPKAPTRTRPGPAKGPARRRASPKKALAKRRSAARAGRGRKR